MDFVLRYFPGTTAQTYTVTRDAGSFTSPSEPLWTASFVDVHLSEVDQSTSPFEANTRAKSPSAWWREHWSDTGSSADSIEAGSSELTHQPTAL